MKRFNLSAWAVSHPTLVLFLILVLGVGGDVSYQKLGRAEDPDFTIKVANVSALWPGATAQEMQDQVADPIEKKLQELPYFDKVADLYHAGLHGAAGDLPRRYAAEGGAGSLLSDAQEADDVQGQLPGVLPAPGQRRVLATSTPSSTC